MSISLCFSPTCSFPSPAKPGNLLHNSVGRNVIQVYPVLHSSRTSKAQSFEVKATDGKQSSKQSSILCPDCEGNGAISCSQCKGTGVNSVDHFNGQFKAGGLCWLCRGKRDVLCGGCNGAGFVGGFMSTADN